MVRDSSPGDLARVYCSRCKQVAFFILKGGPLSIPCPTCDHLIRLEMVHDGRKWRVKDLQTVRRVTGSPDDHR
jgi:hypothetical protein